ncbi:cytochrome b-c1 complex subunit 7 [Phyllosticta citribraziliensis]|uniref:Cytochrome b-c1 complex subunit 7 n=1 Tax=Phyllosticta citribraziliensis TaxID=989973 RepID=A0ABR1LFF2_9PEZI
MSAPSLTNFIVKRPWLRRWMTPLANWYTDLAGYRKIGLRADDLIPEENEVVLKALKRLSAKESYDRVFRMRRAFQCSLSHQLLPKDQWTKPDEDTPYLSPIIREIEAEKAEREDLENLTIKKPATKA